MTGRGPCLAGILLGLSSGICSGDHGRDAWQLDSRGELVRKIALRAHEVLDPRRETVYRLDGQHIEARSFDGARLWRSACTFVWRAHAPFRFFFAGSGRLVVLAGGTLMGFDPEDGARAYRFEVPEYRHPADGVSGAPVRRQREVTLVKGQRVISRSSRELVLRVDALGRFDLVGGTWSWLRRYASPQRVLLARDAPPAILSGSGDDAPRSYLDPRTGEAVMVGPARQLFLAGQQVIQLRDGQLVSWTGGGPRPRWTLRLPGAERILAPYAQRRLLVRASKRLVVVHAGRVRIIGRLPLKEQPFRLFQTPERILLAPWATPETRCYEAASGRVVWSSRSGRVAWVGRGQAVLVARKLSPRRRWEAPHAITGVSLSDGSRRWRWPIPAAPGGDSVGCQVLPTPKGWLILRRWIVYR